MKLVCFNVYVWHGVCKAVSLVSWRWRRLATTDTKNLTKDADLGRIEILFTILCQYICYIWVLCQMNRLFVQTFCFSLRKIKYEPGNASVRPRWCTQDFSPEAYLGPSCRFWRQKFPAKTWSGAPHMRIMRKQSLICNECSFVRLKLTNCTFQLSELLT